MKNYIHKLSSNKNWRERFTLNILYLCLLHCQNVIDIEYSFYTFICKKDISWAHTFAYTMSYPTKYNNYNFIRQWCVDIWSVTVRLFYFLLRPSRSIYIIDIELWRVPEILPTCYFKRNISLMTQAMQFRQKYLFSLVITGRKISSFS